MKPAVWWVTYPEVIKRLSRAETEDRAANSGWNSECGDWKKLLFARVWT